jgi:hypothetical protein
MEARMAYKTLSEAKTQVIRNMSLTDGTNMTPYSDDLVTSYLAAAHQHIVDEHEWAEMVIWRPRTLDGVTGLVTELITDTDDWKDIRRVYHETAMTPLGLLTSYVNPLTSSLMYGYRGLPPEEDHDGSGKYLVRFYPPTLQGRVIFDLNRHIDFTSDPDLLVLPIDWWLHVYIASWMYANDDGTNPGQIQKYQTMMAKRMAQVTAKENSRPSYLQPNQLIPNDWWEADAPYS